MGNAAPQYRVHQQAKIGKGRKDEMKEGVVVVSKEEVRRLAQFDASQSSVRNATRPPEVTSLSQGGQRGFAARDAHQPHAASQEQDDAAVKH